MSSEPGAGILTLYEDSSVKIIPVALAKDAMQLKPGLLYDSRQAKFIGNTLNLDYSFIKQGEPDKDTLKNSAVQEAEVMCLTTLDAKFSMPLWGKSFVQRTYSFGHFGHDIKGNTGDKCLL